MTDIRLATRGSHLALRQAASVQEALVSRRGSVELVEVDTTGDRVRDELIHRLGKTGAFVRSLDERVLAGDCEGAVHSLKDMPTEFPDDLIVAAVPERGPAGDVLVTPDGRGLDDLPNGAVVGTGSLRRRAQLLAQRPDLLVEPIRGNVDTRIEKLLAPSLQREHERRLEYEAESTTDRSSEAQSEQDNSQASYPPEQSVEEWFDGLAEVERKALERDAETEYDALVLAEAGLDRAGLLHHVSHQRLPIDRFVPAPGQGALAVTAKDGGESQLRAIDDPRTRVETTVERTVLAALNGGCIAPIGVHAVARGAFVNTTARVLAVDGTEEVGETRDLPIEDHLEEARRLAFDLADRGATDLIEAAKRDADTQQGEATSRSDDVAGVDEDSEPRGGESSSSSSGAE